jgi:hypothetical protein
MIGARERVGSAVAAVSATGSPWGVEIRLTPFFAPAG